MKMTGYADQSDGRLVIHIHDKTFKTYPKGVWRAVEGHQVKIGF